MLTIINFMISERTNVARTNPTVTIASEAT
jgi:hypothetical protein